MYIDSLYYLELFFIPPVPIDSIFSISLVATPVGFVLHNRLAEGCESLHKRWHNFANSNTNSNLST